MRGLIVASILVCFGAAAAMAQPHGAAPHGPLLNQHEATTGQPAPTQVAVCIDAEYVEGSYSHVFGAGSAHRFIHVTDHGLIISTSVGGDEETSPETETHFQAEIQALRAAAVSHARVILHHNAQYVVSRVAIAYEQNCHN